MSSKLGTNETAIVMIAFDETGYMDDVVIHVSFDGRLTVTNKSVVRDANRDALERIQSASDGHYVIVGVTGGRFGNEIPRPLPPPGLFGRTDLLDADELLEVLLPVVSKELPSGRAEEAPSGPARGFPPQQASVVIVDTPVDKDHTRPMDVIIPGQGELGKRAIVYQVRGPRYYGIDIAWTLPPRVAFNHAWRGPFDVGHSPYVDCRGSGAVLDGLLASLPEPNG
jgi:hypothetical protein